MLRSADVAKMLPCVPAAITASDATKTIRSGIRTSGEETEKRVIARAHFCRVECSLEGGTNR